MPRRTGERRERPLPRTGRLRRSLAHRTALVVAAVTSAALGAHPVPAAAAHDTRVSAGQGVPADRGSGGGQGVPGPLFGQEGRTGPALPPGTVPAISRTDIVKRAASWVTQKVPYSVSSYWSDGYRQDCSGYVSMAWKLPGNEWTGSLAQYGEKITKAELQPGDILLFHNASDPYSGSHVVIFGGWANSARTQYIAYEQTPPGARKMTTPYAYWSNSARYVPYRYKGVTDGAAGAAPETAVPASVPEPQVADSSLSPRARTPSGRAAGCSSPPCRTVRANRTPGRRRCGAGPAGCRRGRCSRSVGTTVRRGPGWLKRRFRFCPGGPSRRARLARGDGLSGPGAVPPGRGERARHPAGPATGGQGVRPHYTQGPGPRWGEEDRRNVADFQRAQGWRGRAADGVPGPETWRRLFA
ncbi:peptidoglycan-binding protein [Streptomyces thermocarboxydus]